MCQSAPSPPESPDYKGAAQETFWGNLQAMLAGNAAMHGNSYTPMGSETWTQNGTYSVPGIGDNPGFELPMYDKNVTLSPEQQALYDSNVGLQQNLMDATGSSLGQTIASLGRPMSMKDVNQVYNKSYKAQTARLDPQWTQNEGMQEQQLANQGLVPGGEAYDNAMRTFNEGKNDAYTQARLAAIQTMPQTFQMQAATRMQPLNELNALRTGNQAQMPQFQATQYAPSPQGPQLLSAAGQQGQWDQQNYQNQLGASNAFMGGLFDLAGAGLQAYGMRG